MDQPSISNIPSWENYKQSIFLVIREALMLLRQKPNLPIVEQSNTKPSLNRELYRCIRKIQNRRAAELYYLPFPVYEGKNLPDSTDEPSPSEAKITDFYWHMPDDLADDDEAELRFVLECKRLGTPPRSDWMLNENYVLNGICRFLLDSHEYGKGDAEGGMIGYIQSMDFADILEEVNQTINKNLVKPVALPLPSGGWSENGISELEHILERPFPVSPFRLRHFWVDIRGK